MNDKDKEAFEKWWMEGFKGMSDMEVIKYVNVGKQTSLHGWQSACEYKQKEVDELIKQLKHEHDLCKKHLKVYKDASAELIEQDQILGEEIKTYMVIAEKLQVENAKLRECVEEISKMRQEVSFYVEPTYPAILCIEVLKELGEK